MDYLVPSGVYYPRVSRILESTEPAWRKAILQGWKDKQVREGKDPNAEGLAARTRGTIIHELRRDLLEKGVNPLINLEESHPFYDLILSDRENLEQFFNPLIPILKGWDWSKHLWCEGPIPTHPSFVDTATQYSYTTEDGEVKNRLWSDQFGYAGCPDEIGFYEGRLTLCDYKTSKRPYCTVNPKNLPAAANIKKNSVACKELEKGNLSYQKTCYQLAAYCLMAREQLNIDPDLMILVCLKGRVQKFLLSGGEKAKAISGWKKKLIEYKNQQKSTANY